MKINEKLGIPKNIENEAKRIFDLIDSIDDFQNKEYTNDGYKKEIVLFRTDVKINEVEVESLPIVITINREEKIKNPILYGLHYSSDYKFDDSEKIIKIKSLKANCLSIDIASSSYYIDNNIIRELLKGVDSSSIAHELMHLYTDYKNTNRYPKEMANYDSTQIAGFPPIISEFLHLIYYMSSAENEVRSSEIYRYLLDNDVDKNNFIKYMNDNVIIKKIKSARDFSLEKFKEELINDDIVNLLYNHAIKSGFKPSNDKSNDILNIIFVNIYNKYGAEAKNLLQNYIDSRNPFHSFLSFLSDSGNINDIKDKAISNIKMIMSEMDKYSKNHLKYFKDVEKRLNRTGNELYKKLFKIYDMIKNNDTKNSITNLHNKINSKNERYIFSFKDFTDRKLN